jgi:hypothetical protein
MRQDQVVEIQNILESADAAKTGSDKKMSAPVELSLDELRNVSGGLLPNGTWSSSDALPNGTW